MRAVRNLTEHLLRARPRPSRAVLLLVLIGALALTGGAAAQQGPGEPGASTEPQGLPPANWPGSPHRGVIDGSWRSSRATS